MLIFAFANACRVDSIGPNPMISGDNPDTPVATTRASGVIPSSLARTSLMITSAAAPSFNGHALPAVTVPSTWNTGFKLASPSSVVCGARRLVGVHHACRRGR